MCLLAIWVCLSSSVVINACGNRLSTNKEYEKRPQIKATMRKPVDERFIIFNSNNFDAKIKHLFYEMNNKQEKPESVENTENKKTNMEYLGEFKLTFYADNDIDQEQWVGQTSTGVKPTVGTTIAVDPKVIPYGSIVYIEGFGERIAQDCGGAIKNNKIDVFVNDYQEACDLGVQYKDVYLIRRGY